VLLVSILTYLLLIVEVLCSLLLIGVILLQRTKAQGAGLAFGAGVGESMFGSQVGNVLTRTTVVLGIIFLVNTAVLVMLMPGRRRTSVADRIKAMPAAAPAMPMAQPAAQPSPAPLDFGAPAAPEAAPAQPIPAEPPAAPVAPEADATAPAAPAAPAAK